MIIRKYFLLLHSLLCFSCLPVISYSVVDYNHQKDVVYGYKDGMALVMDVYSPIIENNKAGIIVVIAGGMSSNPLNAHNVGNRYDVQKLLEAGYVVFATTHSSQPKYTVEEIKNDLPRAIRFIRYNANKFSIDPDRIGILGYSSGGHVGLMAGLSPPSVNNNSKDHIERVSSDVQAIVAYYPSTDLLNFGTKNRTILEHFHSQGYKLDAAFDFHYWNDSTKRFERVDNKHEKKEYFRNNSPINFVSEGDPPTLLIHGDADNLVPIQQSKILVTKLTEKAVVNSMVIVKGKGHGFGFRDIDSYDYDEVLNWFENHLLN